MVLEEREWLNFMSRLLYSLERNSMAIEQEDGWTPETTGTLWEEKIVGPTRIRTPDPQVRSTVAIATVAPRSSFLKFGHN